MKIQSDIPLAPLTTLSVGGSARYLFEADTKDVLLRILEQSGGSDMPLIILGGGSNVVIPDTGLDALVVRVSCDAFTVSDATVSADAGNCLFHLIQETARHGLSGWERLAGIPGTLGGAIRGNAGAFGTEMQDVISRVYALHTRTMKQKVFLNRECAFSYRSSFFKHNPDWVIIGSVITLQPDDPRDIDSRIRETLMMREKKHIQNIQSAGSFFVNPVVNNRIRELFERETGTQSRQKRVPAGWLIEKAGMKGASVGGAKSSDYHANYIINTGGAGYTDIMSLTNTIKDAVYERFGVSLSEEPRIFI